MHIELVRKSHGLGGRTWKLTLVKSLYWLGVNFLGWGWALWRWVKKGVVPQAASDHIGHSKTVSLAMALAVNCGSSQVYRRNTSATNFAQGKQIPTSK